jgi:hypothetical protein
LVAMAEEVGFEPTNPSRGFLFSRQAHSATLPLFHNAHCKITSQKNYKISAQLSFVHFLDEDGELRETEKENACHFAKKFEYHEYHGPK